MKRIQTMKYKIVRDKDYLHKQTTPVSSIEEGNEIAQVLIKFLSDLKYGIGLSANQLGIPKSVSIINVRPDVPPTIIMNPAIIERSKEFVIYQEGCLSIPGKVVSTIRSRKVTVSTLNHANPLSFGPDITEDSANKLDVDYGLLESVCVQHEIGHLYGKLIIDEGIRFIPPAQKAKIKHGRNDKVLLVKGAESKYIKYKTKYVEFKNYF